MERLHTFCSLEWDAANTQWRDCINMIIRELSKKGLYVCMLIVRRGYIPQIW